MPKKTFTQRSKNYPTDMSKLQELLDKNKIKYILRKHPVAELEPQVKKLIGYYPSGKYQILTGDYSIIRGMVSFGYYEIMRIKGKGKFENPERFKNPEDLVKELL